MSHPGAIPKFQPYDMDGQRQYRGGRKTPSPALKFIPVGYRSLCYGERISEGDVMFNNFTKRMPPCKYQVGQIFTRKTLFRVIRKVGA